MACDCTSSPQEAVPYFPPLRHIDIEYARLRASASSPTIAANPSRQHDVPRRFTLVHPQQAVGTRSTPLQADPAAAQHRPIHRPDNEVLFVDGPKDLQPQRKDLSRQMNPIPNGKRTIATAPTALVGFVGSSSGTYAAARYVCESRPSVVGRSNPYLMRSPTNHMGLARWRAARVTVESAEQKLAAARQRTLKGQIAAIQRAYKQRIGRKCQRTINRHMCLPERQRAKSIIKPLMLALPRTRQGTEARVLFSLDSRAHGRC